MKKGNGKKKMSNKAEVVKYSTLISDYNRYTNHELASELGECIMTMPFVKGSCNLKKLALLNTIMTRLAATSESTHSVS